LENLVKPHDHTNFLENDEALYAFCNHLKKPARENAFAGTAHVDDPLEEFAGANRRYAPRLAQLAGSYDILRPGAQEVRDHGVPVPHAQMYELRITHFGGRSPHAKFTYRDLGTPDKPEPNRVMWRGRVLASPDVLYLVGVAQDYRDSVMLILWEHPNEEHLLVGVQLAKLVPDEDDKDPRNFAIARRLAAIKHVQGRNSASLRGKAGEWIASEPMGVFIPIDPPAVAGTRD
jgi:hypothetical protein